MLQNWKVQKLENPNFPLGCQYGVIISVFGRPVLYMYLFGGVIESLTQASIYSPPQLASSLLDSVAEAQRIQASTRRAAVNST